MTGAKFISVFISYSHTDASLVRPVVQLLRANRSLVFQDLDEIRPGKKWRDEIDRGLSEANLVVVFWCQHAGQSEEVANEWQKAIALNKDVLPLLLDGTPLPAALAAYQWIDFRGAVGANHDRPIAASRPPAAGNVAAESAPPRTARRGWIGMLAASVVALGIGWWFILPQGRQGPQPETGTPGDLPQYSTHSRGWLWWLLFCIGVSAAAWFIRRVRSGSRDTGIADSYESPPVMRSPVASIERHIAEELEAEIIRRGSSSATGKK